MEENEKYMREALREAGYAAAEDEVPIGAVITCRHQELPDVQAGLRKERGTRDQIANICWIIEKARGFQKNFVSSTTQKPLTVWIMTNCGKLLERWEYQTILPVS